MRVVFWVAVIGLAVPVYAYLGYPIVLFVLAAMAQTGRDAYYLFHRRDRRTRSEKRRFVSVIVAAHNEAEVVGQTVKNLLQVNYPPDRYEVIIGSDGSADETVAIARAAGGERVRVMDFTERRGKLSVITDCARAARGDILVLADANTLLEPNAINMLVRHFDQGHVGAVCGELRLRTPTGGRAHEGLYWRYEVILKMLESRLDSTLGANGALYAIRKELFPQLPPWLITDDFVIPMKVRLKGFRVLYDPEARASEEAPAGVGDEFRRRIRIGAGNWQALFHCAGLLLPWKGFIAFEFWSHKVFRWASPFLLPVALAANCALLGDKFWQIALALQVVFYGAAGVGALLTKLGLRGGPFRTVFYFVVINAALGMGIMRGMLRLQRATWNRTSRATEVSGGEGQ